MTARRDWGPWTDERAQMEAFCADAFPRLVGALGLHTGDVHLAEELAQEALLRACRRWSTVGQLDSPGGWAYRGVPMSHDLEALLREVAPSPTVAIDEAEIVDRALRQRRAVRVGGVAVALLVGIVGVLLGIEAFNRPDVEIVGQPSVPLGSSWQPLPSHAVNGRVFPTVVWADDRLLMWGGEKPSEGQWHDTGAAFDPSTTSWADMAPAPISPRSEHAAVWTGEEMVVCCGRVRGPAGAAAYNPDLDTWRTIPTSPLGNVEFPLAVWTGQEMLVTGGVTGGGIDQNRATAAYDPDTDRWRRLPDIPEVPGARFGHTASAVWTDTEMIVWPSNRSRPLAFDPESARWSELPRPPDDVSGPSLVWTGREVLAVGSKGQISEELVALGYRPDTATWRAIDPGLPPAEGSEGNFGSQAAVWSGGRMLVWAGYLGTGLADDGSAVLAYHPTNDEWTQLPTAPTLMWRPHLAWTGSELIATGEEASLILQPEPEGADAQRSRRPGRLQDQALEPRHPQPRD